MTQSPENPRPASAGPGSTPRALVAPDGNSLAYETFEADGPVGLVFLHGGGQSRHSWRRAAREFQARGWPCLIYDARGHGDSEWIADGDYRPHGFARDALALLAHWRRPAILVGASLGGITALLAAGEPNPWVAGLVMVDTAPKLNVEEIHRLIGFLDAGDGFESPAAAAAHVNGYFPGSDVSPEAAERGLRCAADGRWYWNWDARVVRGERTSLALPYEQELRDCARRLRVPFLLVRAGASAIVTDAAEADLRDCAPALEVVVLPDAHHMLSGADNLRFVQVAAPFLTRVREAIERSG